MGKKGSFERGYQANANLSTQDQKIPDARKGALGKVATIPLSGASWAAVVHMEWMALKTARKGH